MIPELNAVSDDIKALPPVARPDHMGDAVAQKTESPAEMVIDRANGLRGAPGRRPVPEDFADVLSPEGDSGDVVGSDISDDPWEIGETGSTGGTRP